MSHHDNMTNLAKYNRSILSPLCGVTFSITTALLYLIFKWYGYELQKLAVVVFSFCIISLSLSIYVMFTLQDRTLKLKEKEWQLQKEQESIDREMNSIKEREQCIEHDMRKIKTEQKALEKKKDAYVVFDFK